MSECLITSLEDVLARDTNNAWDRNVTLYRSLGGFYRQVLVTTWDRAEAQRWLQTEKLRYDLLLDRGASILDHQAWKLHCVHDVMAMGWPIGLYLDADPRVIQDVLALGVTTLLVSFRVQRPNWVPARDTPRSWDDLVTFIDQQREAAGVAAATQRQYEQSGGGRSNWPGDVQAGVP